MQRQTDLFQIVGTLGAARRLAGRLDGRKEQCDQHADDRDHHQKLDQRESPAPARAPVSIIRHGLVLMIDIDRPTRAAGAGVGIGPSARFLPVEGPAPDWTATKTNRDRPPEAWAVR